MFQSLTNEKSKLFREMFGAVMQVVMTWANADPDLCG